jgi:DNA-binding NarL/FixJ family response regulator
VFPAVRLMPRGHVTRVLLADDHEPTRSEIRGALDQDDRFTVCAEVGDAAAAVDAAIRLRPDVCLLDVRMPGNGIAAAWEITGRLPEARVVMLTASDEERDLFDALRAGAAGYLLKGLTSEELVDALEHVVCGMAALPPNLVARIISEFRERGPRRRSVLTSGSSHTLTSREWEVLQLLRQELPTAAIADRLFVSDATVRSHVASILRKLRVPNRAAALKLFEEE